MEEAEALEAHRRADDQAVEESGEPPAKCRQTVGLARTNVENAIRTGEQKIKEYDEQLATDLATIKTNLDKLYLSEGGALTEGAAQQRKENEDAFDKAVGYLRGVLQNKVDALKAECAETHVVPRLKLLLQDASKLPYARCQKRIPLKLAHSVMVSGGIGIEFVNRLAGPNSNSEFATNLVRIGYS